MVCGYWGFGNWVTDNATGKQGKGLGVFKCKQCEVFSSGLFSGRVMDVTTTWSWQSLILQLGIYSVLQTCRRLCTQAQHNNKARRGWLTAQSDTDLQQKQTGASILKHLFGLSNVVDLVLNQDWNSCHTLAGSQTFQVNHLGIPLYFSLTLIKIRSYLLGTVITHLPMIIGIRLTTCVIETYGLGTADLALRSSLAWHNLPKALFAFSQVGSWLKLLGTSRNSRWAPGICKWMFLPADRKPCS